MANLDFSLDDLIKRNQNSRVGSTPSGHGPTRRYPNHSAIRAAPYSFTAARAPHFQLEHGIFGEELFPVQGGVRVIETGTKLLVSNLDYGVTDEDIQELFSGFGHLKRSSVNYDRMGRSEGTAEVVFSRRRDAEAAIKSLNNVALDGRPLKIGIVVASPPVLPPASYAGYGNYGAATVRNGLAQGRGGAARQFQGGIHDPRMGRGGARDPSEKISAEDLDADLDKYHADAKQTS